MEPTAKTYTAEQIEQMLEAKTLKAVEKALADREAARPQERPAPVEKSVEQIRRETLSLWGLRLKAAFARVPGAKGLNGEFLPAVTKAIGALEGVFAQGGAFIPVQYSSETIEVLRDRAVLLAAGARTETYKGQFNIGKLNGGATGAWVPEGTAPTDSTLDTGNVILGAHKLMVVLDASNDSLRNPSFNSAYNVGSDMADAASVVLDQGGLFGTGNQNQPLGIPGQVVGGNTFAIAGTSVQNKIDDLDKMVRVVMESKIPFQGNKPCWIMSSKTYMGLKSLRDNAGWIFRSQLEADAPTLNGYPVFRTDSISGKNTLYFGLANQLYFGEETPLEIQSAEPNFKADLTTFRGVLRGDWKLRHNTSWSVMTGVTY
jgi:HK97 family phage major capsid protein